ncbi:hypothetical protein EJB05_43511, partial [Eragrostis curvula]
MASRRVAAIRQGDLGVDRKQAQVQALPDIDLYSRSSSSSSSSLCFSAAIYMRHQCLQIVRSTEIPLLTYGSY